MLPLLDISTGSKKPDAMAEAASKPARSAGSFPFAKVAKRSFQNSGAVKRSGTSMQRFVHSLFIARHNPLGETSRELHR